MSEATDLLLSHFLPDNQEPAVTDQSLTYRQGKDNWEYRFLKTQLEKYDWNVSKTAKELDLSRSHLSNLIKLHKLSHENLVSTKQPFYSNDTIGRKE